MDFEELLIETEGSGLIIKEKPLKANAGRIRGNRIAIKSDLASVEKSCVLAEELGHYYTSTSDILDQADTGNRKQERHARLWAYNHLIGLHGIIQAYQRRCQSLSETAEFLNVSEDFLSDALELYRQKYGQKVELDNYIIFFEPGLAVMEKL
ncbi:MAG: ImmA/IrrE family metallo-endopeptidase [Lachnospiraceae bacterium]|nr:ImmA/IrrE family metallo-endopeptidase [Lachnospiraceae bacterium]